MWGNACCAILSSILVERIRKNNKFLNIIRYIVQGSLTLDSGKSYPRKSMHFLTTPLRSFFMSSYQRSRTRGWSRCSQASYNKLCCNLKHDKFGGFNSPATSTRLEVLPVIPVQGVLPDVLEIHVLVQAVRLQPVHGQKLLVVVPGNLSNKI